MQRERSKTPGQTARHSERIASREQITVIEGLELAKMPRCVEVQSYPLEGSTLQPVTAKPRKNRIFKE